MKYLVIVRTQYGRIEKVCNDRPEALQYINDMLAQQEVVAYEYSPIKATP